jgi:hypothetical protein
MELTVTVKADAGATERSGKATVADTVNKAELSRLFIARAGREMKKKALKMEKR